MKSDADADVTSPRKKTPKLPGMQCKKYYRKEYFIPMNKKKKKHLDKIYLTLNNHLQI